MPVIYVFLKEEIANVNYHIFYKKKLNFQAPFWAYLQAALGLFLYQTLDAIDGKQARRTGSSSPLGELFDHGCDSMTQGTLIKSLSLP